MNRSLRILQNSIFFFSALAVCLFAATQVLAADASPKPPENGLTDYILSYLVVILGIVLGLLVVARASSRRDRERPAGYVEKNILGDE